MNMGKDPFETFYYDKEAPKQGLLARLVNSVSDLSDDAKLLIGSIFSIALLIGAPIYAVNAYDSAGTGSDTLYQASMLGTSSESFLFAAHNQFAIGAHSGMMIAGVAFSDETDARIAAMREERVVKGEYQDARETALLEMRALGAIAGGQGLGETDLVAYLDHLDDLSAGLTSIATESRELFNAIPGISNGPRLANLAKAIAILGDDMIADGGVDVILNPVILASFDKDHAPSRADIDAVRSLLLDTVGRIEEVAKTDAVLVTASRSLVRHQASVFGGQKIRMQDIVIACPFEGPLQNDPDLTTQDDDCRPG